MLLYSLLILLFLGLVLLTALVGPEQGRMAVQRFYSFMKWNPPKPTDGLLTDTEASIKKFNDSYRKVNTLRQMTLARSQQAFEDLNEIYKQTRENLKSLLLGMGQLSVTERMELFQKFSVLHSARAQLVEVIIRDQQIMINLNEQMDQQLQAMSRWLNEKSQEAPAPTLKDVMRMQQYENLREHLKAFNEQSSNLDSMRILFMKKSKDSIGRLAETNRELENRFRELLSYEESPELWRNYQKLEAEQRELVDNLRTTEEFISVNQNQLIAGVTVIAESVEYTSDSQMQRFRDNYAMMEDQRRELLKNMHQNIQVFQDTKPTRAQLLQDSRYRMESMREHASMIADQYEQLEENRKSASSMIRSMTREINDKNEFASQQTEDAMERNRNHIQTFLVQMDSAQGSINDFIKNSRQTELANNPSVHQLENLQEKSKSVFDNLKNNEEQLRSLQDQAKRDQNNIKEMKKDSNKKSAELVRDARERTQDQKRMMSERIKDEIQRIKDMRMDQRWDSENK
jgi:hypothetical protein